MSVIKIEGMRCPRCKSSVEKAMDAVPNAGTVTVSLEKGEAEWDGSASPETMKKAVEEAGFSCPFA